MNQILDTVLLLALPASGKSEVRRYLELMPADARQRDFHMGPSVQLDDFPYVHVMRRLDDELVSLGHERMFFQSPDHPFRDPLDWGTLIELINEDHEDMLAKRRFKAESAGLDLMDRLDRASVKVGASARLGQVDKARRGKLAEAIAAEARKLLKDKQDGYPESLSGKTLVIEFARGGPQGSPMPLCAPFGYRYSLGRLSPKILEKAAILYIWVTPEQSRLKNEARSNPKDPGSILHHGVPIEVMLNDYGCDDMEWLAKNSQIPGSVTIQAHGRTFHLPLARFDNRQDKTSFLRQSQDDWKPEQVEAVHEGLRGALDHLAGLARR
ncbi:MAG TPA: hypothetical protein DEB40_06090 [Elusimicrobia bacterium]|nr:hypothetical protein [Elusimicrobiota bacterium]HBT61297.1 hypothetical protein [Elusimicrobiota bacterium]